MTAVTEAEISTGAVTETKIGASAVTAAKISTAVAGNGLAGGGGTALSVNVDDSTIEINSDSLRIKNSGVTESKIDYTTVPKQTVSTSSPTGGKQHDIWIKVSA
jgi:hypothetical protein